MTPSVPDPGQRFSYWQMRNVTEWQTTLVNQNSCVTVCESDYLNVLFHQFLLRAFCLRCFPGRFLIPCCKKLEAAQLNIFFINYTMQINLSQNIHTNTNFCHFRKLSITGMSMTHSIKNSIPKSSSVKRIAISSPTSDRWPLLPANYLWIPWIFSQPLWLASHY